jgi:hypothetical protein
VTGPCSNATIREQGSGVTRERIGSLVLRAYPLAMLAQVPKLQLVASAPHNYKGRCCVTENALLYVET